MAKVPVRARGDNFHGPDDNFVPALYFLQEGPTPTRNPFCLIEGDRVKPITF